ncbi:concanavalin A-like lectin/glucanase domain-containing protein [Lactarius quietus]|nr:concanavalin A-like lectin/glucanase domain-containing protein [Lactarius quietus]
MECDTVKATWIGNDFYEGWNWETENDPTHGRVNYVGLAEARAKNLTYVENGAFFMRADDVTIVPASARGRDSIRISSQTATWPAFWTLSQAGPWPNGGEIDVIEGVNLNTHNQATLHTTPNCTMPPDQWREPQTGETANTNCDTSVNFNSGCGVIFSDPSPSCTSYGAPFNQAGGGYFVMYRATDSVKIWFFPRDGYVPEFGQPIYPDFTWGSPAANFPFYPQYCDYDTHFNAHEMVFDLTFCGDWAGNVWSTSGCGSGTCPDFVNNNPSAFAEAYWEINSLRVYTPLPSW